MNNVNIQMSMFLRFNSMLGTLRQILGHSEGVYKIHINIWNPVNLLGHTSVGLWFRMLNFEKNKGNEWKNEKRKEYEEWSDTKSG